MCRSARLFSSTSFQSSACQVRQLWESNLGHQVKQLIRCFLQSDCPHILLYYIVFYFINVSLHLFKCLKDRSSKINRETGTTQKITAAEKRTAAARCQIENKNRTQSDVVCNLQFLQGVFLAISDSQMMQITTPFGFCCCLYEISHVTGWLG